MVPRIPSAAKISRSLLPVVRLHQLSPRHHTLPVPSNIHTHTPLRSPLRRFHPASRNRARHLAISHPYMAIASRRRSKHRHRTINTLLIKHHQTQRVRMRSCTTLMEHVQLLRVPNRPIHSLALPLYRRPTSTTRATKCLCSFSRSVPLSPVPCPTVKSLTSSRLQ